MYFLHTTRCNLDVFVKVFATSVLVPLPIPSLRFLLFVLKQRFANAVQRECWLLERYS